MENDRHDALLTLILARGFGPTLIRRCVDAMGDPQAVVEASSTQLSHVEKIGSKRASSLRLAIDQVLRSDAVEIEKVLIKHYDVTLIARGDEEYPLLLRHIPDPPPLLYVKGAMRKEDAIALDVVGARKCTVYGREQADRLSAMSSQAGLVIISGGAYGIDAVAHRAALRVKGRTIAVLGSGMANPYPKDHIELFGEIADPESDHGAVISELPMTTPPMRENFSRRNRIVSGMSLGVLVVEASSRSGALITARLCAEDHNREVLAVPGRVDSRASDGCHRIIREGWATLVTNVADVLDALGDTGQLLKAEMEQGGSGNGKAGVCHHGICQRWSRSCGCRNEPI